MRVQRRMDFQGLYEVTASVFLPGSVLDSELFSFALCEHTEAGWSGVFGKGRSDDKR